MNSTSPKLSIVMPVYNREKYIQSAIDSILNQTFIDFEFIIINDGSRDNTVKLIEAYCDPRIKLYHNDRNRGIVYSRNHGLQKATGYYVGMFDSDDIAMPDKFEKQVAFLDQNPQCAMVGAWVRWIDGEGSITEKKWKLPAPSSMIPAIMFFRNYFVQSTVVIRYQAIPKEGYSQGYSIGEDTKMWFDVSLNNKVANLQEYLVYYRVHGENITSSRDSYMAATKKLVLHIFSKLNLEPTDEEVELYLSLKTDIPIYKKTEIKKYESLLYKIYRANVQVKLYDEAIFRKVLFNRWLKVCKKAKRHHVYMLMNFITSPITRFALNIETKRDTRL